MKYVHQRLLDAHERALQDGLNPSDGLIAKNLGFAGRRLTAGAAANRRPASAAIGMRCAGRSPPIADRFGVGEARVLAELFH
jgi:hypothetical protein